MQEISKIADRVLLSFLQHLESLILQKNFLGLTMSKLSTSPCLAKFFVTLSGLANPSDDHGK
jgi:hypothetical protein